MAATYVPIQSVTLSSSAASVTFSAIPQTYTDLVVRVSARYSQALTMTDIFVYVNGSQVNYTDTSMASIGSTTYSWRNVYSSGWYCGGVLGASATANTFSSLEVYLPNYSKTAYHAGSVFSACENNATSPSMLYASAGLRSDTTAVTSITFDGTAHDFVAGSTFHLYGIKNS